MTNESPFFLTKVECPVCKTINEFETIKVGSYIESGHDTDFCPRGREWRNPKYAIYNPLLFFMATCEDCFCTREFNHSFKDWKNDIRFKSYQLKQLIKGHLEELGQDNSVVRMLGGARDPQRAPFGTAVVKLLLGIFDELLFDHPKKLDIGRFFLRIAWLYREHYGTTHKSNNVTAFLAKDLEKAYQQLANTRQSFDTDLNKISALVDDQLKQCSGSLAANSDFLSMRDGLKASLDDIASLQEVIKEKIASLQQDVFQNCRVLFESDLPESSGQVAFGGFPSFEAFMVELKKKWKYAPLSEAEAMLFAIEFYSSALKDGKEIQPGNQQIQATYLIAELSRRVNRYSEAKSYFNSAIKIGQQFVFNNRHDQTRTALARKIIELAIEQGKANLAAERVQADGSH